MAAAAKLDDPGARGDQARAALAADNPRLAREFALDVPGRAAAALLQWSDLLESPKSALRCLPTHPGFPVEPEALAAGFEKLARSDSPAPWICCPCCSSRPGLTPASQVRLQRAAALGAAYDHDPRALVGIRRVARGRRSTTQPEEWRVRAAALGRATTTRRSPTSNACPPAWRRSLAGAIGAPAQWRPRQGADAAAPLFERNRGSARLLWLSRGGPPASAATT